MGNTYILPSCHIFDAWVNPKSSQTSTTCALSQLHNDCLPNTIASVCICKKAFIPPTCPLVMVEIRETVHLILKSNFLRLSERWCMTVSTLLIFERGMIFQWLSHIIWCLVMPWNDMARWSQISKWPQATWVTSSKIGTTSRLCHFQTLHHFCWIGVKFRIGCILDYIDFELHTLACRY